MSTEQTTPEGANPDLATDSDTVVAERYRCAEIVQAARFGEIDTDWRTIIYFIEGGRTLAEIKRDMSRD